LQRRQGDYEDGERTVGESDTQPEQGEKKESLGARLCEGRERSGLEQVFAAGQQLGKRKAVPSHLKEKMVN
jgi:hypothetical protein